jgi:hypothetical protein
MEAWVAAISQVYTLFILRDLFGKIVPGAILLFSVSAALTSPSQAYHFIVSRIPTALVLILLRACWTTTLGTQRMAEWLHYWSYWGSVQSQCTDLQELGGSVRETDGRDHQSECAELIVARFRAATKDQEFQSRQYERFVVIKEATGNFGFSALLSLPAWLLVFLKIRFGSATQWLAPVQWAYTNPHIE